MKCNLVLFELIIMGFILFGKIKIFLKHEFLVETIMDINFFKVQQTVTSIIYIYK